MKATSQWICVRAFNLVSTSARITDKLSKIILKKKIPKTNLQQFLTSVSPGVSLFPTFAPTFFCHHRALTRRTNRRPKVVPDSGACARRSRVAAGEWMVTRHRPRSQRDAPVWDGTPSWGGGGGGMSAAKVGPGGHTWHRLRASRSRWSRRALIADRYTFCAFAPPPPPPRGFFCLMLLLGASNLSEVNNCPLIMD